MGARIAATIPRGRGTPTGEDRLEALYAVAVALGLRQGEALGLRSLDVDLDTRTLRVTHSLRRVPKMLRGADDAGRGSHYVLVEPKTARSRRTIAMPSVVTEALRRHRLWQLRERVGSAIEDDAVAGWRPTGMRLGQAVAGS